RSHGRISSRDGGWSVTVEISLAGGRVPGIEHIEAENEPKTVRQWDRLALILRVGWVRDDRIGHRATLVIDLHVIGPDHITFAVEHRRHPMGRSVERRHACR